jgi:hypothetical protein
VIHETAGPALGVTVFGLEGDSQSVEEGQNQVIGVGRVGSRIGPITV